MTLLWRLELRIGQLAVGPDPIVRATGLISALLLAEVTVACGAPGPGGSAARAACIAYEHVGRRQVTTTRPQTLAIWNRARTQAETAASTSPRWTGLSKDIDAGLTHLTASSTAQRAQQSAATDRELDAYFAADRRVEADCTTAGHRIGPLKP